MWVYSSSASSVESFTEGQQRCDVSGRAEGLEECMRPIKFNLQTEPQAESLQVDER